MRVRRLACLSLVLICLVVAPSRDCAAQTSDVRSALTALRDSLVGQEAFALPGVLPAAERARTEDPRDAYQRLRLGFIELRLGEVRNERDLVDKAAGEFDRATQLQPAWPWAWYGLGLARAARGEGRILGIENIRQWLNTDHLSGAATAFRRAGEVDAGFSPAAVALANVTLAQRIRPDLRDARAALVAAESLGTRDPSVPLARGRVERELGDVEASLAALERALAAGGDSGVTLFELARTQYLAGRRTDGYSSYFTGAGTAISPQAVALYRRDIAWIASPAELTAFDGIASSTERVLWLREFWRSRDRVEGWPEGARLAEHNRRWLFALEHYRLVSAHRKYNDIADRYRNVLGDLDDRGVVYMRHGEPDAIASYHHLDPNESWRYDRPGGAFVVHFVTRGHVSDYRLIESLLDVFGAGQALSLAANSDSAPPAAAVELFQSRSSFSPMYDRLWTARGTRPQLLVAERDLGRRGIAIATTTDSYPRQ